MYLCNFWWLVFFVESLVSIILYLSVIFLWLVFFVESLVSNFLWLVFFVESLYLLG